MTENQQVSGSAEKNQGTEKGMSPKDIFVGGRLAHSHMSSQPSSAAWEADREDPVHTTSSTMELMGGSHGKFQRAGLERENNG